MEDTNNPKEISTGKTSPDSGRPDGKASASASMPDSPRSDLSGFLLGNGCMMLAAIFWGVNVSVTKALVPHWMPAAGVVFVRLALGALLFWIVSLFLHNEKVERRDWPRMVLGGTVGLFGFIFLFVKSVQYGSPIDVSIIMTLPPMFVILGEVIFKGRRPGAVEYVGIGVSFAGAVVVILGGARGASGSDNLLGNLLAIASAVCYAFYLIIIEEPSRRYRPVNLLRWMFLFAAVPSLLLIPQLRHMPIYGSHSAVPWLEIGFVLLCPTFLAYFLVQPAVKRIGSMLVSLYQYLLPVFAAVSAVLMGLERLKALQVVAMVIIIAGMALTNLAHRRRGRAA